MKTLSLKEYRALLKAQKVSRKHVAFVCPMCKSVQSMDDLIRAKAGKTMADVEKYIGFSCVGRFTHHKPPDTKSTQYGCNWTLGGLFQVHELEVVAEDGKHHPSFEIATPEQAQTHKAGKT